MPTAILKAHYDGKQIVLDEPFELPMDTPLTVTVLARDGNETKWSAFGKQSLGRAYSDDEPEYTTADIKPR